MEIVFGTALNILLSFFNCFPSFQFTYERLVRKGEEILRKIISADKNEQMVAGALLTLSIGFASAALSWLLLWAVWLVNPLLKMVVEIVMFCFLIDIGKNGALGLKIYRFLENQNAPAARVELCKLVDWDVGEMDEEEISRTAIEAIARNMSDGIFAPLLFMLVGGVPLAFFCKAVDMTDSIIGYKNPRYLYFGRFAAFLNNFLSFVPSRIASGCMLLASRLLGYDYHFSVKIFWRDRENDESGNNGQMKAVCAGALGIRLGGAYTGLGVEVNRPSIGDDIKKPDCWDIRKAVILMYSSSAIALFTVALIEFIFR
ncbi:MAG: cobalamin biosynthesis protein [Clostridia bacterium]|nr:cobalamin biosynthesis protein [Clostridia bacterium]